MGDQIMADESILGLLLRAHAEAAAQSHGERYVFDNLSSSSHYDNAVTSIANAIRSIGFAEIYIARSGERKKKDEVKP